MGVIDKNGNEVIEPKYNYKLLFNEGFSGFSIGGTKTLIEGEGYGYYDYLDEKKDLLVFLAKKFIRQITKE